MCRVILPDGLVLCQWKGGNGVDQKRIGSFLKELRKEKELTQEQLAERFNVSDRTVSRWENGNNMPDLSILVELADFYDVDVREIIDGERKSEAMNQEEKEKMLLVAEYADEEKTVLLRRLRIISIIGLCSMVLGIVMMSLVGYNAFPVTDYVIGVAFGVAMGALITAVFYSTGVLAKIRKTKNKIPAKIMVAVCAAICIVLFVIALVRSF
ncbi:MAG: helix-turn-helix domain-containing protein [Lachnospiraceae bacterium]|nr:helix-turn-helix domain-containing protein [Lachnospiraceae bacterium]